MERRVGHARFQGGDGAGKRALVSGFERRDVDRRGLAGGDAATREHVVDHALEPHALTVLGRIDARGAVRFQLADLGGHDHAAAAAEDAYVPAAPCTQMHQACT